ncbi:sporulation protein YqfD, partial [Thermodesulfitimonas sp.]
VEQHLKEQFPAIAWVGVKVRGGKAMVRIAEKRLPAPVPSNPAHIVARKAGLIKELLVLEGQPLVKEGDTVLPGQVLISGEVVPGDGESGIVPGRPRYTRAKGIVRARVWYEGCGEALLVERGERVGRSVTVRMVRVASREFRIQGPKRVPYARYRVRVTAKKPLQWRNFGAPVELINKEFTELIPYEVRRTGVEARRLAEKRAWNALRPSLPVGRRILSKRYVVVASGRREVVQIRLKVEVLEDIGQVQEFKQL